MSSPTSPDLDAAPGEAVTSDRGRLSRARGAVLLVLAACVVAASLVVYWTSTPQRMADLTFGFGPFVEQLLARNVFPSAARTPAVPIFLAAVATLGGGTLAALVVKNLLLQPLLLWSVWRAAATVRRRAAAIAAVVFVLTFPQLVSAAYALVPEEAWLIPLLGFLAYELFFGPADVSLRRAAAVGGVIALVLLTKSSMRLLCPMLVLLFALKWRGWARRALLASICLAAFLAWGAFNAAATGHFRLASSQDGYNLRKGNHPQSLTVYAYRSLDELSSVVAREEAGRDEWGANDAYLRRVRAFWRDHPGDAFRLAARRAFRMFVAVRPITPAGEGPVKRALRLVGAAYMLVFRVIFFACAVVAVRRMGRWLVARFRHRTATPAESSAAFNALALAAFVGAYSAPYLVGFAYQRHVLPLVVPTVVFGLHSLVVRVPDRG